MRNASTIEPKSLKLPITLLALIFLGMQGNVASVAAQEDPDKSSTQTQPRQAFLIGRIETIVGAPELHIPGYASYSTRGLSLQGTPTILSYPSAFEGQWSGPCQVDGPEDSSRADPDDTTYPGRVGEGRVGFAKSKDQHIEVSPMPIVYFELTDAEKKRRNIKQEHYKVWVGFGEARNAVLESGAIKNSHIVINVVRPLAKGHVFEQQIVEESQITSPATRVTYPAARESVFQFSLVEPDLMDVYLAGIEYKKDGTSMGKIVMHGRLKRQR